MGQKDLSTPPVALDSVILLTGAMSTRPKGAPGEIPKPLALVNGKPFLEHVLLDLKRQGALRVVISVQHDPHLFEDFVKTCDWTSPMRVEVVREKESLGTGGLVKWIIEKVGLSGWILLGNAETIIVDGWTELSIAARQKPESFLGLVQIPGQVSGQVLDQRHYNLVQADAEGKVTAFMEKAEPSVQVAGEGWVFTGTARLECKHFRLMTRPKFSIEREIFPAMAKTGKLRAVQLHGKLTDASVPADLQAFAANVAAAAQPASK